MVLYWSRKKCIRNAFIMIMCNYQWVHMMHKFPLLTVQFNSEGKIWHVGHIFPICSERQINMIVCLRLTVPWLVVSRQPLTAETQVCTQVSPCGIFGGQTVTGTSFLKVFFYYYFPFSISFHCGSQLSYIMWRMKNRSISSLSLETPHPHEYVRFQVIMVTSMKTGVFWDVEPCNHCSDDVDVNLLWNIGQYLPHYMVQHHRRQLSLWWYMWL
jgi:hypothetical protein